MFIDFTIETFKNLPKYEVVEKLDYIRYCLHGIDINNGGFYSVKDTININRSYTFKAIEVQKNINYCLLDLITTVQ